jgi:hypothetical protein
VDIIPTEGAFLGLNTAWFKKALASAIVREFAHTRLRLITPVAFLATKHVAFSDRGEGDYYGIHDLEDFITLIDGRDNIVAEVNHTTPTPLRSYVVESARRLMAATLFNEALPGHLPPERAGQQRLPALRRKLQAIAALQ